MWFSATWNADCGNSTIKLGLAQDGGIWQFQRLSPQTAALDEFIKPFDRTITELALMPGAKANTALVESWWAAVGNGRRLRVVGDRTLPAPDLGQYPNCGIDRVLAGLVGCIQERKSLVVIDAGTATTMTAWRYEPDDPNPLTAKFFGINVVQGLSHRLSATKQPAETAIHLLHGSGSRLGRTRNSLSPGLAGSHGRTIRGRQAW